MCPQKCSLSYAPKVNLSTLFHVPCTAICENFPTTDVAPNNGETCVTDTADCLVDQPDGGKVTYTCSTGAGWAGADRTVTCAGGTGHAWSAGAATCLRMHPMHTEAH